MCLFKMDKDFQTLLQMSHVVSPLLKEVIPVHISRDWCIQLLKEEYGHKHYICTQILEPESPTLFPPSAIASTFYEFYGSPQRIAYPILNVFLHSDLLNVSFYQPRISNFSDLRIFLILVCVEAICHVAVHCRTDVWEVFGLLYAQYDLSSAFDLSEPKTSEFGRIQNANAQSLCFIISHSVFTSGICFMKTFQMFKMLGLNYPCIK